jgi:hypothetical protein
MPYKITNLTRERLTIDQLRLLPGIEASVDDLSDNLTSAWHKQLIYIDPPPGSGGPAVMNVNVVNTSANPVPIIAPVSGLAIRLPNATPDVNYFDITTTPTQVLPANANRKSLFLENTSGNRTVWLAYSSAECLVDECIKLPPNYYYEVRLHVPTLELWLRTTTGTARVIIEEGT